MTIPNVKMCLLYVLREVMSFCVYSLQDLEQDAERSHQTAVLRSLCLPRLSFLLLSVLQNSSRHQEALRLADIISADQHRLYQVNTPHLVIMESTLKW